MPHIKKSGNMCEHMFLGSVQTMRSIKEVLTQFRNNKRGISATMWLQTGLGIAFGIILIAVVAIVLAAFNNSTDDANATAIINNGQTFLVNLTAQLGTVGTVAGVLLLLGLVVASGIGGYMVYNKARQ